MWLLAGLGVLIWAAFSVFLSGTSAHAGETPGHSSQQQSSTRERPGHPELAAKQLAERPAQRVQQVAPAAPRILSTVSEAVAAPREAAPQRITETAPQRIVAAQEPAPAQESVVVQAISELKQRPEARSLLPQAKAEAAAVTGVIRRDRADDRARNDGDRDPRAHAEHADNRPAPATAPLARLAHAKHASHAASASMRTARTSAAASVTLAAASGDTAEHSPLDSRGTSTHHQPATPPSVASAAAGSSASPGVLPGTAHAGDVLGLLLTAAHADDDVLPSGPAGSTDNSPD